VSEFISNVVTDEDDKLDYFNALNVEMRSNAKKIDVADFINKHFSEQYKQPLLNFLAKHGISSAAFIKDVELLPKQGRSARLKTTGGLTISGDTEAIKRVRSEEIDEERVILIHDTLKTVT